VVAVPEPTDFGSNADDAFAFMSSVGVTKGLTQELDEDNRARAFEALRRTITEHETDDGVLFGTSAWLITGRAARRTAVFLYVWALTQSKSEPSRAFRNAMPTLLRCRQPLLASGKQLREDYRARLRGKRLRELGARVNAELGKDFAEVVFDGVLA
jgi:hypothetical protein